MTFLAILLVSGTAQADPWRTWAGGFTSRWNTLGHHGHDQPGCGEETGRRTGGAAGIDKPDCDATDFARANLDDSIGFRAGAERDLWTRGPLHLVGGADAGVSHTEFNLSQRDFSLLSGSLFSGVDLEIARFRLGARYGIGAFATTTNHQLGAMHFTELSATLPLRGGAAVRVSRRNFRLSQMHSARSRDLSVVLVSDGSESGRSSWEFSATTGTTHPGLGMGSDRELRGTAMNRMTAARRLPWRGLDLEMSWSSTAHESSVPSIFLGYDGNFRSRTIDGYGVAVAQAIPFGDVLSVRWSAGVELADWRDEHRLLTRDSAELVAGIEAALTAGVTARLQLQPHLAIQTSLHHVYWRAIDLGEVRWTTGIVLTR